MWIEFLFEVANETLSAISFIHPAHAVHRSAQADIIDDTIGNIQQAINDLITLTVGETMKIRATTAGSVSERRSAQTI